MLSSLLYGLRVQSNRVIPRARQTLATASCDLQVTLGTMPHVLGRVSGATQPWYSSDYVNGGQPSLVVGTLNGGAWFHLRYADGTEFLVDRLGTTLWATWPDQATIDDTATYLLGPVMGFVLLLRGIHSLHGSAVAIDGRAIALVGPAGAGKSTTAAAFVAQGYRVLSEDVAALVPRGEGFSVLPAYPCIRLWPESVEALFGAIDALPALTPNWDKRYLDLDGGSDRFQQDPLPLAAVYVIGERSDDPLLPRAEAISPSVAMMALTGNSYVPYLKDKAARAAEFELLGRLVSRVPVRRVIPHGSPARIPQLCDVILDDFRGVRGSPPSAGSAMEIEHV